MFSETRLRNWASRAGCGFTTPATRVTCSMARRSAVTVFKPIFAFWSAVRVKPEGFFPDSSCPGGSLPVCSCGAASEDDFMAVGVSSWLVFGFLSRLVTLPNQKATITNKTKTTETTTLFVGRISVSSLDSGLKFQLGQRQIVVGQCIEEF